MDHRECNVADYPPQGNSVTSVAFSSDSVTSAPATLLAPSRSGTRQALHPCITIPGPAFTGGTNYQSVALGHIADGTRLAAGYASFDTNCTFGHQQRRTPGYRRYPRSPSSRWPAHPDGTQIYSSDANNHIDAWSSSNARGCGNAGDPIYRKVTAVVPNPSGTVIATGVYQRERFASGILRPAYCSVPHPASGANAAVNINALAYSSDGTMLRESAGIVSPS